MNNVAGLSTTESQRASDMYAKTRYLDELTGSKGVIFATGTPISNSIAEMYTVQRYLQYETLKKMGMAHFDSWASRFGETVTSKMIDTSCIGKEPYYCMATAHPAILDGFISLFRKQVLEKDKAPQAHKKPAKHPQERGDGFEL